MGAAFWVFVVVMGGLILPTLLIGIVTVAFDQKTKQFDDEETDLMLLAEQKEKLTMEGIPLPNQERAQTLFDR